MLNLIENFKEKARKLNKTIVLPEGEEPRVIRAAEKITAEGFAKIIILGDEKVIREKCPALPAVPRWPPWPPAP